MELDNNNATPQGQQNAGTEQNEDTSTPKTYTQEELDSILQKETDRRVSQALATQERKNIAKMREAEKLSRMSESEQAEYRLRAKEEELEKREREICLLENKAEASKILADKGLPIGFLDFVVSETADEMNERIQKIEKTWKTALKQEVEKRLGNSSKSPSASTPLTKEAFDKMSLKQKNELYKTDKELYMSFINP